jgi:predicted MPP superfamily phosphohydrolase
MHVGFIPFELYLGVLVVVVSIVGALPFLLPRNPRLFPFVLCELALIVVALIPLGAVSFGGIHVLYAVLTCCVPAIGVVALVSLAARRRTDHRRVFTVLAVLFLLPAPFGFYATNIEPRQLVVHHEQIGTNGQPLRVVVLSDIQSPSVGAFEKKVVKTANDQQGDLLLYAGDLYSGEDNPFPKHFDAFTKLVSDMHMPYGTYVVPGDHDGDDKLPTIVGAAGKTFLQEQLQVVKVRGMRIGILGLDTDHSSPSAISLLHDLAKRTDLDYKIVLEHKPDVIFNTPTGIDLVVAGHTHGGQVNIPFIGPVMTLSSIPRKQAAGGLFEYSGGRRLFVTSGAGEEHGGAPLVRFNDKPEVAVLDIAVPTK